MLNEEYSKWRGRKIILVGYRATGKSAVAALLAERLDIPAVDSDVLIEQQAGKTIARIFADEGERGFRLREEETVAEILDSPEPLVFATGGGVPTREANRRRIQMSGAYVVWLTARPETILARLVNDEKSVANRPALTALPPEDEIRAVLEQRTDFYRVLADLTISTDDIAPEEIAWIILQEGAC